MTRDTIFRVASMVKLFTTVAALRLVSKGDTVSARCARRTPANQIPQLETTAELF
jgi:hypothetical protein